MADSPYIFEATPETFQQLVVENSYQVPVLVDFWADWCQPCKMLIPLLTKLANEYQGDFIVAKVDTDQYPQLASRFAVRNLPTVKLFRNGQVVDEFMGVQPEGQLRSIINRHRPRKTEPYRQQALGLYDQGDVEAAIDLMQQVLQHEPDFHEAALELAGMLLQQGKGEAAEVLLKQIPAGAVDDEILRQMLAEVKRLKLRSEAGSLDTTALKQRLAAQPDDLAAMLELARMHVARDEIEAGLDLYLAVHTRNSTFQEGAAKKGLLSTLELLGAGNPLVKKYRNKLFSTLY